MSLGFAKTPFMCGFDDDLRQCTVGSLCPQKSATTPILSPIAHKAHQSLCVRRQRQRPSNKLRKLKAFGIIKARPYPTKDISRRFDVTINRTSRAANIYSRSRLSHFTILVDPAEQACVHISSNQEGLPRDTLSQVAK